MRKNSGSVVSIVGKLCTLLELVPNLHLQKPPAAFYVPLYVSDAAFKIQGKIF